jgi:3D (Asp-Asp-Asp) domain-containing protein
MGLPGPVAALIGRVGLLFRSAGLPGALCAVAAAVLGAGILAGGCGPRTTTTRVSTVSGGDDTEGPATAEPGRTAGHEGPITGRAVQLTLYYLATQKCPDSPQVGLPRCGGGSIARVSQAFLKSAKMQGSAKLCDGRVVGVHKLKPLCFALVGDGYPWGVTASGRPASPFRSIAVDPKVFTLGRWYYVAELAGMPLPPPAEGKVHDGCVRADDVGGAVKGDLVDLFVGDRSALGALKGRLSEATVHLADGASRCASANTW